MATANNDHVNQSRWNEVKVEVQKTWSRLTQEELDLVEGDFAVLAGLIHQKYGTPTEEVMAKLNEFTAELRRDLTTEESGPALREERDGVRGTLRDQYRQF